jgi:hypothetical protein
VNYGNIFVNEDDNDIFFGVGDLTLVFSKETGQLSSLSLGEVEISSNDSVKEMTMVVGGLLKSNILKDQKNYTYPSVICEGGREIGNESVYLGYEVRRPIDGVELCVKVKIEDFTVKKFYHITSQGAVGRRLEIAYLGEDLTSVQYIDWTSMGIRYDENGLSLIEVPLSTFPGSVDCKKEQDICLKAYPYTECCGTAYVHNKKDNLCVCIWAGDQREAVSHIYCQSKDGVCSIGNHYDVNAFIRNGESLAVTNSYITANRKGWLDNVLDIRAWFEHNGFRCRVNSKEAIKALNIYETEVGTVEFSENAKHCEYEDVSKLIDDIENIRNKGFNAIQLMPSFPYPGYTIVDLKDPELQHNTQGRLKELVQKAHAAGVKVILDVLLHGCLDKAIARWNAEIYGIRERFFKLWLTKGDEVHPIRKLHPDWFIYLDDGEVYKKYTWLFDAASEGFQNYVCEALRIFVEEYDIDGFRFDAPQWGDAPNRRTGLDYLPSKSRSYGVWELFYKARNMIDGLKEGLIWINEVEGIMWRDVTDAAYPYSSIWKWELVYKGEKSARDMQSFYDVRKKSMPLDMLYINFADNHDTWFPGELGLYSHEKFGKGFARAMFAANLFAEGGFMVYAGFEYADLEYYTLMLRIKNDNDIFRLGECDYSTAYADNENVFCTHWKHNGRELTVCVNCSDKAFECTVNIGGKRVKVKFGEFETKFI